MVVVTEVVIVLVRVVVAVLVALEEVEVVTSFGAKKLPSTGLPHKRLAAKVVSKSPKVSSPTKTKKKER